jgi:hypothetical protein
LLFSIGVGSATITSHSAAQGTIEAFQVIGMNILVVDILFGVRMFRFGSLIFRTFWSPFVSLATLVLEPYFYARLERFLGRPT